MHQFTYRGTFFKLNVDVKSNLEFSGSVSRISRVMSSILGTNFNRVDNVN